MTPVMLSISLMDMIGRDACSRFVKTGSPVLLEADSAAVEALEAASAVAATAHAAASAGVEVSRADSVDEEDTVVEAGVEAIVVLLVDSMLQAPLRTRLQILPPLAENAVRRSLSAMYESPKLGRSVS